MLKDEPTYDATLTIGYPLGNRDEREIVTIEVVDANSRIEVIEIEVDLIEFARAIKSRAFRPCKYTVRAVEAIGKTRESKQVTFNSLFDRYNRAEVARLAAACREHEVDGWKADIDSALRKRQPADATNVTFYRYV